MATLITKRGNGVPTAGVLTEGELAIDLLTGRVYTLSSGVVIEVGQDTHPLDFVNDADTTTTAPADGDILTYDGATNTWVPQASSGTSTPSDIGVEAPRSAWKEGILIPNGFLVPALYTPRFDTREVTISNPLYVMVTVIKAATSMITTLNRVNGASGGSAGTRLGFSHSTSSGHGVEFKAWTNAEVQATQTASGIPGEFHVRMDTGVSNGFIMYQIFVIDGDIYDINNISYNSMQNTTGGPFSIPNKTDGFSLMHTGAKLPTNIWMFDDTWRPSGKFNGSSETANVYPGNTDGESCYIGVNWNTGADAVLNPAWRSGISTTNSVSAVVIGR